ncbi:MAG: metallophosphoesterase, partial [Clostridia bacterium]|nr:metallophosphoesterase [Deltaproteobacteria bacterium]
MPRIVTFLLFFLMMITVMSSIHFYLWTRFIRDLELGTPWRQFATGAMITMLIVLLATPVTYRLFDRSLPPIFITLVYAWMGFVTIALTVVGGLDIARLVALRVPGPFTGPFDESKRLMFARAFGGAAILGAVGVSVMAARGALGSPKLKNVTVSLKRLPAAFDKLKLVQISDLHVGPTIKKDYVQDVVDRTNALKPDIIVITGDLVDGSVESLHEDVAPIAQLKARLGVFFVTGN